MGVKYLTDVPIVELFKSNCFLTAKWRCRPMFPFKSLYHPLASCDRNSMATPKPSILVKEMKRDVQYTKIGVGALSLLSAAREKVSLLF